MNRLFTKHSRIILCLCMVVCLIAGCAGGQGGSDPDIRTDNGSDGPAGRDASENNSRPDDTQTPYEVVIENMTLGQEMPDLEAVEAAINEITLQTINCTVSIMNIHIADHATKVSLMIAGGEKIDLLTTGRTVDLSKMVSDGVLMPLDELLDQHGQTILEKSGALMDACRIKGAIYAIPGNLYPGMDFGFEYNVEMARELGIEVWDHMTWKALEDVARVLRNHGIYLMTQGTAEPSAILLNMMNPTLYDMGGTNYIYGVIDDISASRTILNLFDTQYYLDYCLRMRYWQEEGFMPPDSLYSGENPNNVFKEQRAFLQWTGVSPSELVTQAKSFPFELGMFTQKEGMVTTHMVQEGGWGISVTSGRPDKAMDFLNLLYGNGDLANLLMNGLEGREYQKVSDNIITYADNVTSQTLGYQRNFSLFGDTMQTYQWVPASESYYDDLRAFMASMEPNPLLGYNFDTTAVSDEVNAVNNVIAEYMPALECGVVADVEGTIRRFNAELETAGIKRIIEANQAQLNQWLRENK